MKMIFDEFQGRTALVTGAASGMGLLTSQRFAENGANVVMVDANEEAAEEQAAAIREKGGKAIACRADVRFFEETDKAARLAVSTFGSIDFLVNFAGGYSARILKVDGYFPTMDPDAIDWGLDVNLKGQVHFARAVLKTMIDQGRGVIINIGSTSGVSGAYGLDYSAAKSGAMNGLTKSLALYGAKHGVRCCCVSPGPVLTRPAMANMATPIGYAAEPWEIVDFVLYLCSDHARSMTGANYIIDGGRCATALDETGNR